MRHNNRGLGIVVAIAMSVLMADFVSAQTTTEVKQFEIVSVDGNRLVVRGEQGTEQITVTDDFRLTVDGLPITVRDLRPGMRGMARTTTSTTTVAPEQDRAVKHGEIVKRNGTSVLVKTPEGTKTYTDTDLANRSIPVTVDGKPVRMSSLWEGTKLTETIVTTTPERVVTRSEVEVALQPAPAPRVAVTASAPAPVPPPAAAPPAEPPAPVAFAPETQVASSVRPLPNTASLLPTIGLLGVACSAAGLLLTMMRRRRRTGEPVGKA